ncbi:MAG: type I-B CRISPR-associated protein Cas5b [Prevotella sp.]|jgi:CRISPR-associated protein Cas5t|nr:type I-B CRISPR-associated protein Cas5b [Prevotella sp.]
MTVYRITISSWTSSFRYPNIISGYQPTLLVPPISTVLGLLNACSGRYLEYKGFSLGYYFYYAAKSTDLETIYQVEINDKGIPKNQVKSNIINREFLYDCKLVIYLTDIKYVEYFRKPVFSILLGRSNDLASVDKIEKIDLKEITCANKIRGQVVPFVGNYLPGTLQALPTYYTNTIPRNNIGTEAYSVISYDASDFSTNLTAYRDNIDGREVDIYFHKLNFEDGD